MLHRNSFNIKTISVVVAFLLHAVSTFSQTLKSPFLWKPELAVPTVMVSFSALGGAYEFSKRHPAIPSQESILRLKPTDVNRFDRSAIYQHSQIAAFVSDVTLYTTPLLPLILLENQQARKDFGKIITMDAEVFLLNTAVTNLFKEAVHRPRPLAYNSQSPVWARRSAENFRSFFSGHTSTVASQAFFFAYVWQQYHPNNKFTPLVWTLTAGMPIVTGVMRYKAGKHFWTDIITGYAVGALIGVGVPWLHTTSLWQPRR